MLIYKLSQILVNNYVLYILFLILCLVLSWKYLRIYYYISKVPGPLGWPILGNALLIKNLLTAENYFKLFKDNGSFFKLWLGPIPLIFTSDPNILQTLYTSQNTLDKGWIFRSLTYSIFKNALITADVEKWKRNRKICNYAFTQTVLNSFMPIFNEVSKILIAKLKYEVNKKEPFDVFPYFRLVTLDSICGTAMGIKLNSLNSTSNPYAKALERVITNTAKRFCSLYLYPEFIYNMTNLGKERNDGLKIIWDMANKVTERKLKLVNDYKNNNTIEIECNNLDQRIEKNPLKKPFLEFLLKISNIYPELTIEQLKEETNFVIMAGFETTASSLSYALLALAARKDIQNKAYNEVFSIFGNSERAVELEDLSKLKYVEMIIKETLRLYPSVVHIAREASDDINLGGYNIPAGTTFLISILETHRNPYYWENPMEFNPERFLTNRHPYAFIPFSSGPRNCIGGKYAMMFMKLQLANILRKYEIHTNLKMDELHFELDIALKLLDKHLISLTERAII